MDRCVIMVDAGYVYAAGGLLCCGTPARGELVLDAEAFVAALAGKACDGLGRPVLRTYWYDGARDGIRTEEQQTVAGLNDVKLRLGRLNGQNQQKGVDALIYRDMITLAQHRAVTEVVLVSGDEDLHEGVRTVQDYGVRVVLVGIDAVRGFNQSRELIYEADQLWTLEKAELAQFFTRRGATAPTMIAPAEAGAIKQQAIRVAVEFAAQWRDKAEDSEMLELFATHPRSIPRPLDLELITAVEQAIGRSLRGHKALKKDIRAAWWGVIGGGDETKIDTEPPPSTPELLQELGLRGAGC